MINTEKMLYQQNKSGSSFVVLFIVLNMVYTIMTLKHMPMSINIGIFTMFNILISLVGFLASTMYSSYKKQWALAGAAFSIIQFSRFLFLPVEIEGNLRLFLTAVVVVSAVSLLVGSIITLNKTKLKEEFEKENGYLEN